MIDARQLRFGDISGIKRKDLPIAVEIWLQDITSSGWATRDVIKLATLFSAYIKQPKSDVLDFNAVERSTGLEKDKVVEASSAMTSFGAMQQFDYSGPRIKATLNLSFLQRLRVLELCCRFAELRADLRGEELPWHARELRWAKTCNVKPDGSPRDELIGPTPSTPELGSAP